MYGFTNNFVYVYSLKFCFICHTCGLMQAGDQIGGTFGKGVDALGVLQELRVARGAQEQLCGAPNACENVVEVVADTGGKFTYRAQTLGANEFLLGLFAFGNSLCRS